MDNNTRIKKAIATYIVTTFKNEQVVKFLSNHPMLPVFIGNMCEQMMSKKFDKLRNFDARSFNYTVAEMTKMFCHSALKVKEEQLLSENERALRTKKGEILEAENKIEEETVKDLIDARARPC